MYVEIARSVKVYLSGDRVPIYAASSWASIMSQDAAFYLDPLRDIYEVSTGIVESTEFTNMC